MKITDKMRLDFMNQPGRTWHFTKQMRPGVYSWEPNERGDFYRSVRAMVDAAIRQQKRVRRGER